jgi:glycosyltransferase involved in cell wall biosynthesis
MIRVLYDHQAFLLQGIGGISRYFAELMCQFASGQQVRPLHSALLSQSVYGPILPPPRPFRIIRSRSVSRSVNSVAARILLAFGKIDVFHPTYYDTRALLPAAGMPLVVTVYDMMHELFPELGGRDPLTIANKRAMVTAASRVIAISETTRQDIVRIIGVPQERIDVVHLATRFDAAMAGALLPGIQGPFVLYVGTRGFYKNFPFLVKALASIPAARRPRLVCAGGGPFTGEEQGFIAGLGMQQDVSAFPRVTDSELASLYCGAACLAFPSHYEGFGLPLLEAFACRCPVVAAKAGPVPEIAADAALYFGPDDVGGCAAAIDRVTHDRAEAERLKKAGAVRGRDYSWEKTAAQTVDVYKRAMAAAGRGGAALP